MNILSRDDQEAIKWLCAYWDISKDGPPKGLREFQKQHEDMVQKLKDRHSIPTAKNYVVKDGPAPT